MKTKNIILNTLFLTILGGALFYSYQSGKKSQESNHLNISLETPAGEKTIADFSGKYNLVYFGFLTCPDICPTTLKTFSSVFKEMKSEELEKIQMLFIDLDPERDTLEGMKIYASHFHSKIIPLRTNLENLKKITEGFGIYFKKVPLKESNMSYTIDHSTGILYLDPNGNVISVIDHDSTVPEILAFLRMEMKNK